MLFGRHNGNTILSSSSSEDVVENASIFLGGDGFLKPWEEPRFLLGTLFFGAFEFITADEELDVAFCGRGIFLERTFEVTSSA